MGVTVHAELFIAEEPNPVGAGSLSAAVTDHGFVQVAGFTEHLSVKFDQGMEGLVVAMGTGSRHKITIPFYQYSSASSMVEWSPSSMTKMVPVKPKSMVKRYVLL